DRGRGLRRRPLSPAGRRAPGGRRRSGWHRSRRGSARSLVPRDGRVRGAAGGRRCRRDRPGLRRPGRRRRARRPARPGGAQVSALAVLLQAVPTPSVSPTPVTVFGQNVIGFSFLLSTLVWAPVGWAIVLATIPNPRRRNDRFFYGSSFWLTAAVLAPATVGYMQFQSFTTGVQYEEKLPWLPAFGITYHLGVDGVSMAVLMLNTLVSLA